MIVVDTSAIVAVMLHEPDGEAFLSAILDQDHAIVAAPSILELTIVLHNRRKGAALTVAERMLSKAPFEIAAWSHNHAILSQRAFTRYGKGRHPAALNFGDCMVYAVAKSLDVPLLFKGDDFRKTDITPAL